MVACSLLTPLDGLVGADAHDVADTGADASAEAQSPDAGTDANDAGTDARDASCPSLGGPAMVRTPAGCVDTTEVTQAQYQQFLASPAPAQLGECAWNTTFVPGQQVNGFACSASLFDPNGTPNHPVRCVDWCDARTFCAWAGKQLCGALDGGVLAFADFADGTKSAWMAACSRAGTQAYPYGPAYTPCACRGADGWDGGSGTLPDVKSAPSCVGGYPGIFDMSGDVVEWEGACSGDGGAQDTCRVRGGDVTSNASGLACDAGTAGARQGMGGAIGFRCCAP